VEWSFLLKIKNRRTENIASPAVVYKYYTVITVPSLKAIWMSPATTITLSMAAHKLSSNSSTASRRVSIFRINPLILQFGNPPCCYPVPPHVSLVPFVKIILINGKAGIG